MKDGFIKVACATPEIKVADCEYNSNNIITLVKEAELKGASLVVFPELCVTGYTCADLFLQDKLLAKAEESLIYISNQTKNLDIIIVVGLPIKNGADLYNCAAFIYHGEILGFVPKTHLPNYAEFQEARYFSKSCDFKYVNIYGKQIPIGNKLLFICENIPQLKIGIEICEDLWVTVPQSSYLTSAGATVIANLSSSSELVGKSKYRLSLVESQSSRLNSAYLYADSGKGESTTDLVFSGHNMIAEIGAVLAESQRFTTGLIFADIDLYKIEFERRRDNNFNLTQDINKIYFYLPIKNVNLERKFEPLPFVPNEGKQRFDVCKEVLSIQSHGLLKRIEYVGCNTLVLGLSGGLDSTLALLVAINTFDMIKLNRKNILAITMPCFGTTQRTQNNAKKLCEVYGVTLMEIPLTKVVKQHFIDIGQDINDYNTAYENAQARERTQVLMDVANQRNGLVIGTGDLSELALGWSTYNGDHMSMYAINCSVPKTLVKHLIKYKADTSNEEQKQVLLDILATPISPELLPSSSGTITQATEHIVGPYELHDFFLYYFMRFGFEPKKIYRIAKLAFKGMYDEDTIKKWLKIFIKRFFTQQFKRSCMPDGPKVGSVSISPRSELRMPSDAVYKIWLEDLEPYD